MKKQTAGMMDVGNTIYESKKAKNKDKDPIKMDISFKDIDPTSGQTVSETNLQYAIPPTAMEKLYALYKEDETIAGLIDKTASVASSEKIDFTGREAAISKAVQIMKQTFLVLIKSAEGVIIRKRTPSNEFFKYEFTDFQIYNNAYFEVKRSIDGSNIAFVYKDPRYIRVLKDHLGYVEIKGLQKYYYNNYTSDRRERQLHRLHYTKGLIKGTEVISSVDKKELVQIRGYGNEYYGLSALYSTGTSSLMQTRSKQLPVSLLGNGMLNTPIINFSGAEVSKDNKKEIEEKMKAKVTGHTKSGTPVVLYSTTPGSKIEVKGMPRHEFDLDQVKTMYKLGESNVLKRFGFPPEKLSIIENSNRATITESDQIMTEEIVNPLQSLFEFQFNIIFQEDLNLDVEFKFKDKTYDTEKIAKISRTIKGMTYNEIREKVLRLEKSTNPAADELVISNSERLLGEPVAATPTAQKDERINILKDEIDALIELRKNYEH